MGVAAVALRGMLVLRLELILQPMHRWKPRRVSGIENLACPCLEGQAHVDELWYQHSAELPCLPIIPMPAWMPSTREALHPAHPGTNPEDAGHQGHVPEDPPRERDRRGLLSGKENGSQKEEVEALRNPSPPLAEPIRSPPGSSAGRFALVARFDVLVLGLTEQRLSLRARATARRRISESHIVDSRVYRPIYVRCRIEGHTETARFAAAPSVAPMISNGSTGGR